ncbi:MAG: DNA polymerase III subunit gamma/tau [Pyrinomonadaceae bacterium]
MAYQVIARKWRPQSFAEVTGQEPITRTLVNALEHDRLHHAYVFSGARGVGKTTTARLLAKALNCHKAQGPTATPCAMDDLDACASCREITESRSIDVLEIDAASNTGVDNVREVIISGIGIAPARDRNKVFIIDEVHMLTPQSFNALLKTLEEPPPNVTFIMATTEAHKIPDTILSRTQQFEFRTIATAKIAERLRIIADAEKIDIEENALREVARAGEGSMRDAQSAFDQVISFSGDKIVVADVSAALGLAGTEMLDRVVQGIADRSPVAALSVVEDLEMRGHDLRNFCRDLLGHLRDLLVAKVAGDTPSLLESSIFDPAKLKEQAAQFSESDLIRFFHSLAQTESSLKVAAHPRYQLEIGLIKLMEMQRVAPLASIIERLAALEGSAGNGGSSTPPAPKSSPASSTPPATGGSAPKPPSIARAQSAAPAPAARAVPAKTSIPATKLEAADIPFAGVGPSNAPVTTAETSLPMPVAAPVEMPPVATAPISSGSAVAAAPARSTDPDLDKIKKLLEKKRKPMMVTALDEALSVSFEDNELVITFAPESRHMRVVISKPDSQAMLREVCQEVLGRTPGIRVVTAERDEGAPLTRRELEAAEQKRLREVAEQIPAVQRILDVFQGEIVDVRVTDQ